MVTQNTACTRGVNLAIWSAKGSGLKQQLPICNIFFKKAWFPIQVRNVIKAFFYIFLFFSRILPIFFPGIKDQDPVFCTILLWIIFSCRVLQNLLKRKNPDPCLCSMKCKSLYTKTRTNFPKERNWQIWTERDRKNGSHI